MSLKKGTENISLLVAGPQGPQGPVGPQGPQGEVGPQGPAGKDGAIQYTAGDNITISADNVISAEGSLVDDVKVNGTSVVVDKIANVIVPTKTSELTNDSDFAKTNANNNFTSAQTINGTLTINGDIVQNGSSYETHAEHLFTKNDIIKTRDGAVGGLAEGELTGIEAINYDGENNGRLAFDNEGIARVGDVGDEQPLLTRDEATSLTNGQVLVWDSVDLKAKGSSDYVKNTDYATASKDGIMTSAQYSKLDGIEAGAQVNTITSVDGSTGAVVLNDVKYTQQSLTDSQKEQARNNINAATFEEYDSSASSYEKNVLYYVVEE